MILQEAGFLSAALGRFVKRFNPKAQGVSSERVFVGAFGKHPGWDDHIDDIGLETEIFVNVKRLLYVQGIGGNIDSGSWGKLEENELIEGFKHVFVWCMDGNLIVGRLWSSRDGKGRTSYPMVVCIQCRNLPVQWVFENILPRLEGIEARCVTATSAADVRMMLENARQELRRLAEQCRNSPDSTVVHRDALAKLARRPELGPDHEGLLRVLYHIDREIGRHRSDNGKGKGLRPTLLRVPAAPSITLESAVLWSSFLVARFGRSTPVLILMPLGKDWMDIIVGEPTESQLYCLRAPLAVIPLTTSIPYNMGSEFIERANQLIVKSQTDGAEEDSHEAG